MEREQAVTANEAARHEGQGTALGGALFASAIVVLLAVAGVMTRDFPASAARLPRLLVLVALAFAIVLAVREWAHVRRERRATSASPAAADTPDERGTVRRRLIVIAVLTVGQLVLLKLTGVIPSIGVFLLASMSVLSVSIRRTVVVTAGLLVLLYILFGSLLRMPMFEGLLVS